MKQGQNNIFEQVMECLDTVLTYHLEKQNPDAFTNKNSVRIFARCLTSPESPNFAATKIHKPYAEIICGAMGFSYDAAKDVCAAIECPLGTFLLYCAQDLFKNLPLKSLNLGDISHLEWPKEYGLPQGLETGLDNTCILARKWMEVPKEPPSPAIPPAQPVSVIDVRAIINRIRSGRDRPDGR